ncbi:hypothetical protein PVAND_002942 [Polypedilum vanderplanki]|uniref:Gustatory receptor n=1 Tax=Polypedilum vanderplanki TaxID=319348 RepID=A0A9J6BTE9_POLVA|nr:hypothetical protein PVAND_002942 [Polypedilum vanderplanki]
MADSMVEKDKETKVGTLTAVIGIFIIYLEPFMMAIDIIASIINQQALIDVFDRLRDIDEKLERENIYLNYWPIKRASIIFIIIFILGEISLNVVTLIVFQDEVKLLQTFFWILGAIPLFVNGIAKTWFLMLIMLVQQRLRAINTHLNAIKESFVERKLHHVDGKTLRKDNLFIDTGGYLEREIFSIRSEMKKSNNVSTFGKIIKVAPYNKDLIRTSENSKIGEKLDRKLINLCRAHDEICEIAKQVNRMFSIQMLITMAYGFIYITAQFYFMYCGLLDQTIPALFNTANNIGLTISGITYTAYKFIVVIYISWRTKIDSQKTGVQLHKISNVVDENHLYNVCNHLSLKLLNHHLNFTACGFFDLDMETIYAISGAITSYLIILIQFNLAAKRPATSSDSNNATTTALFITTTTSTIHP